MFVFLGLIRVDFVKEETGEAVKGWNLWLGERLHSPSIGYFPAKKWLTEGMYDKLIAPLGGVSALEKYVGKEINLIIGLKGQLQGISLPK